MCQGWVHLPGGIPFSVRRERRIAFISPLLRGAGALRGCRISAPPTKRLKNRMPLALTKQRREQALPKLRDRYIITLFRKNGNFSFFKSRTTQRVKVYLLKVI